MAAPLLTAEHLAGVYAKLERANENIRNFKAEITAFLREGPHAGGFSEDKEKQLAEWDEWVVFHAKRGVPPRFGVLAGEIIHHLRSSLDHVAWLLSSDSYRQSNERDIAFPILIVRPTTKSEVASYNRKVGGITSAEALSLIESIQPYNARDPLDDPLAIIHDLNRVDKHHTIVLVVGTFDMSIDIPPSVISSALSFGLLSNVYPQRFGPERFADQFAEKVKIKMTRQVAIEGYGKQERETVIPALTHLENAVRDVVKMFGR